MKLIVGLGNPGAGHAGQRHNIGFMAVEAIAAAHGFGPWRARFQGQTAEGRLGDERAVLLKPQTFMNLSGQSVGEAMRYLKLTPADVIVLHDELDLAPGQMRIKQGGGHAGHNGLRSMHQHIGEDYSRVRLGIGHPGHKDRVSGYVLSDFAKADADWLAALLDAIAAEAPLLAAGEAARFQTAVAARLKPARNKGRPEDGTAPTAERPANPPTPPAAAGAEDRARARAAAAKGPLQALRDRFRR